MGAGLQLLCQELVADLELNGATVTVMIAGGHHGLVATSGGAIGATDALQFDLGEGPSRDCFESGRPVLVPDLERTAGRWPGFASTSMGAGVRAVYAFPLQLGASRLGVLTGYSEAARGLTRPELWSCALYAEVATEFLIDTASGQPPSGGPETFLEHDVLLRTEVYQAQGIVKVALGVSLAEALARLRAMAFAESTDLNSLAADIVARRRPPPRPDAPEPHREPPDGTADA